MRIKGNQISVIAILASTMAKVAKKYAITIIFNSIYDKFAQLLTGIGVFHISKVIWINFKKIFQLSKNHFVNKIQLIHKKYSFFIRK